MKTAFRSIVPLLAPLLLLGACMRDDSTLNAPGPTDALSVRIASPGEGARVEGNVIELEAHAEGVEITEPDRDGPGNSGHFHVFIDRDPVASGETISDGPQIVHFTESPVLIPGLTVGNHTLTVVLGDGNERRIGRVSDTVEVEVMGPSIDATAPESAPNATGFTITTTMQGAQISEPSDGDEPAGPHLDLIIDPDEDPQADGQPIPEDSNHIHTSGTAHEVEGLPAGEHTIWVVLTDQNHVPVNPMVADRVEVTIR